MPNMTAETCVKSVPWSKKALPPVVTPEVEVVDVIVGTLSGNQPLGSSRLAVVVSIAPIRAP
jgi:hypothetical protein